MMYVALFSLFAHLWVIVRAVRFFLHPGAIRERDKAIVATMAVLSFIYIVLMAGSWPEIPWPFVSRTMGTATMVGFVFANSMLYLGLIKGLTERRQWHLAQGRLARSRRS